jgi:hypothetical protein
MSPGASADPAASPSDDAVAVIVPIGPTTPGGTGGGTGGSTRGNGGGSGGAGGTGGDGIGALFASIATAGFGRPEPPPLGLVATLVTTSSVVTAAMAFGLFGKRRRDGDQPDSDDVLAAAAAGGVAVATAVLATDAYGRHVTAPQPVLEGEMAMPRWRRPSLLEARKADPIRDATVAPRLTFDHGLVGPLDGHERRLIRYNVVRLLDTPDELRGNETGFLDQGDEVQLLEKYGVYWLVLCPDGRQGWIHKMTLGDVVGEPERSSSPTATMPIAADTWTMGDDVDGDVLAAYLESRRRA